MSQRIRLTSEERRAAIIAVAREVFAENGFHGTTTRELSEAAGVSEALLFKHFPSKEAIYQAMLDDCKTSEVGEEFQRMLALPPGTSSLIVLLHYMVTKVVSENKNIHVLHRLMARSLGEDGGFARVIFKSIEADLIPMLHRCIVAAYKAGDAEVSAERLKCGEWLTQHVMLMIAFMHVPQTPAANYKTSKQQLTQDAVVFALRGLGIRGDVIKRLYNPQALALLASRNFSEQA